MSSDVVASVALNVKSSNALNQIDAFDDRLDGLKKAAAGVAQAVAGMFAGSKAAAFGNELLQAAAHGQEIAGKFSAVFKSSSAQAQKAVDELAANFNFNSTQAQESMATMADIFTKSGLSIQEALEYSSQLNQTAADVEAFTDCKGGLERVTQALTSAMLGEREMAKSLGIVIREDDVKSQMAAEAADGLKFSTEGAAKMHATYALILRQTANSAGQVARESDGYSNKARVLQQRIEDLKGAFGEAFIEPASKIVGMLTNVAEKISGLSRSTKSAIAIVGIGTPVLASFGIAVGGVFIALKNYANVAKITEELTRQNVVASEFAAAESARNAAAKAVETTAETANSTAKVANAAATTKEAAATTAGTAATNANANASGKATTTKIAEAAARNANAAAATKEAAALTSLHTIEKAGGTGFYSGGWRSRLSSGGVEIASGARTANRAKAGGSALSLLGNIPGLKQLKSLGNWFAKLVPIGGKLGFVLKGLARFGGPIAAVITALEALKHGPALLEKFLNEWLPKIQEALGKALKWAWNVGLPAVGKWVVDLIAGALNGAKELGIRLGGIFVPKLIEGLFGKWAGDKAKDWFPETETQKSYRLEKELATAREKTAKATQAAQAAEKERAARAANSSATTAAFESTGKKIAETNLPKETREYLAKSAEFQEAVDAAKTALDAFDPSSFESRKQDALAKAETSEAKAEIEKQFEEERKKIESGEHAANAAKAAGELQLAKIAAAQFQGEYEQKTTLDALQKDFEAALEAAKTDVERADIASVFAGKIGDIKRADAQASATVATKESNADRYAQIANDPTRNYSAAQRQNYWAKANEARTAAAEARANLFSGDNLTSLNELEKSIRDAAKSAEESLSEQKEAANEFAYRKKLDAFGDDKSGRISAIRSRADALEKSLEKIDDPAKKLELEKEIYSLRKEATDDEKTLNEERKKTEEKRLGALDDLILGELKTASEKWNFYSQKFANANASFDAATTDDERFSALDKMKSARESALQIEKEAREKAKRNSAPIDAQMAMTRGSADAFKIESRLRNVYQNKMLAATYSTNAALGNIYRRLQEMARPSVKNQFETATLVVEN